MHSIGKVFFDGMAGVLSLLKHPSHIQMARNAWENAQVAKTHGEAMEIFAALQNEPSFSNVEEGKAFSHALGRLVEGEVIRFQNENQPEGDGERPGQVCSEERGRKRHRTSEQDVSAGSQPPLSKRARVESSASMADLPSSVVANMVSFLSPTDERALFWTSKMPNVREGIFLNNLSKLLPFSVDPECQHLYELVFGKPIPSVSSLETARRKAIENGDIENVNEMDKQLREEVTALYASLPEEWEALPSEVKTLFGNIETSEILKTPERFKDVLKAIRAYNLNKLGESLGYINVEAYSRTKIDFLKAAELTAKRLKEEENVINAIYITNRCMTRLPLEITRLPQLKTLSLCGNQLRSLPPEIGNLTQLETLWLYDNKLEFLPPEIGNLTQLETLPLDINQLESLPPEIGNLTQLKILSMGGNQLKSLPSEIGNLTQLKYLWLRDNQLRSLPSEIGNLTKLTNLGLSGNQLRSLPSEIGNLTKLTNLALDINQLESLPPEIGNLTKLENLCLSDNLLRFLPPAIGSFTKLKNLWLDSNRLESLPPETGNLTQLEDLKLESNQLRSLPLEIGNLGALLRLSLRNNYLSEEEIAKIKGVFLGCNIKIIT